MSNYKFSNRSLDKLKGIHPVLIGVCFKALELSEYDFGISEGVRTLEKQREYVETGKSTTLNSKHLTGHAVDIMVFVDNKLTWDLKYYKEVSKAFKEAAKLQGVTITWGGDWNTFVDGVHFEVSPTKYV